MKKLNKVNVKRNDTVAAFACRYNCTTIRKAHIHCNKNGAQYTEYYYVSNQVSHYVYHK